MEDLRFGSAIRAARVKRGLRQVDVGARARCSDSTISRLEDGHVGTLTIDMIRVIAAVLDVRVELLPRSRGGDLDRLLNARHSALLEAVTGRIGRIPGWILKPEVSFAFYGERGVIDLVAWHDRCSALLLIELKTSVVDIGELLGTTDRRERLAAEIATRFGWRPRHVSTWVLVADSRTNKRRIDAHRSTFRAAFPSDGRKAWSWLHEPAAPMRALAFMPDSHPRQTGPTFATRMRVSRPRPTVR